MFFVYFFMITVAVLYAIAYEPELDENGNEKEWKRYVAAVLFLLGIIFILMLTKSVVDVEGASRTLSLNMFVHLLDDKKILKDRGYKVVHYSVFGEYVKNRD